MQDDSKNAQSPSATEAGATSRTDASAAPVLPAKNAPREIGGPQGPEPTRFGDWERKGRCIDF